MIDDGSLLFVLYDPVSVDIYPELAHWGVTSIPVRCAGTGQGESRTDGKPLSVVSTTKRNQQSAKRFTLNPPPIIGNFFLLSIIADSLDDFPFAGPSHLSFDIDALHGHAQLWVPRSPALIGLVGVFEEVIRFRNSREMTIDHWKDGRESRASLR